MPDLIVFRRPTARADGLIITRAGAALLVYDQQTSQLHHLDDLSAAVWQLLDGSRSVAEIFASVGEVGGQPVTLAGVERTIVRLGELGLLEPGTFVPAAHTRRSSRRRLLKQAGSAAAVAGIVSITAPMAAAAASCSVQTFCTEQTLEQPCCGLQDINGNLISLETGLCIYFDDVSLALCADVGAGI